MITEPFRMEHLIALQGQEKVQTGIVNMLTGPAFSLIEDKKVLACGGVRVAGIGEAWAVIAPDAAAHRPKSILQAAREVIERASTESNLYRLYAEASVDKPAWFRHLGFVQSDRLYVR